MPRRTGLHQVYSIEKNIDMKSYEFYLLFVYDWEYSRSGIKKNFVYRCSCTFISLPYKLIKDIES